MLLQETEQLLGRPIDRQLVRLYVFLPQHMLEQFAAKTAALAGLVHVKVEHTRCRHVDRFAGRIKHVQRFAAHLQYADDETTKRRKKRIMKWRFIGNALGKGKWLKAIGEQLTFCRSIQTSDRCDGPSCAAFGRSLPGRKGPVPVPTSSRSC